MMGVDPKTYAAARRATAIRHRMNELATAAEDRGKATPDELTEYEDIERELRRLQDRWGLDI